MNYQLSLDSTVIRLDDGARIPADPANADYIAYFAWLEAGNTPQEADPAPVPPLVPSLADQIMASPSELEKLKTALGLK